MTIYSALVNGNSKITAETKTAPVKAANGLDLYVTIPNWSSFATIDRVILKSNAAYLGDITLALSSNGAKYRADNVTNTGLVAKSTTGVYTFDTSTYVEDDMRSDFGYLRITGSINFGVGNYFTVYVEGTKQSPSKIADIDNVALKNDLSFKVLQETGSSSVDLTKSLSMDGNPTAVTIYDSVVDYLYIGSDTPMKYIKFVMANPIPDEKVFTAKFWNGAAWVVLGAKTVDNTSSGQYDAATGSFALESSGTVEIPSLATWVPCQVTSDPTYIMTEGIKAGTISPIGFSSSPARYWIRLESTTAASIKAYSVMPLRDDI